MAAHTATTFHKPRVLVVEGKDDFWVCVQLLQDLQIETVQVIETNGFTNLAAALTLFTKTPGWPLVERLAILVDCDGDSAARTESVQASIRNAGLPEPNEAGTFAGHNPAVAFCLLPANGGCLEDVIRTALADAGALSACVDQFISCCGLDTGPTSLKSKAWVHAYIAATNPGLKVGEAARAGLLQLTGAAYEPIRALISGLAA